MRNYESEFGTKQSCSYEVRHFYKKLFFNPGIYFDRNPFPNQTRNVHDKTVSDLNDTLLNIQISQETDVSVNCEIQQQPSFFRSNSCESWGSEEKNGNQVEKLRDDGFDQANRMFV